MFGWPVVDNRFIRGISAWRRPLFVPGCELVCRCLVVFVNSFSCKACPGKPMKEQNHRLLYELYKSAKTDSWLTSDASAVLFAGRRALFVLGCSLVCWRLIVFVNWLYAKPVLSKEINRLMNIRIILFLEIAIFVRELKPFLFKQKMKLKCI